MNVRTLRAFWLPSLADLLLAMMVLRPYLFGGGWSELLSDASVGMHIRTGDLIRATLSLPTSDPFSFALPGKPWFAWEWLTEILLSLIHSAGGLSLIALSAVAILLLTSAFVLRTSLESGSSALLTLLLVLTGFQTSLLHALARPHLATWLFIAISVHICQRERRAPSRLLWLLVPLCALWANIHGGFAILPVYLGLLATGLALERDFPNARRFLLASSACAASTLLNPYGIGLHRHMLEFLSSPWVKGLIQEYHAPSPDLGEPFYWFFALSLASSISLLSLLLRRRFADACILAFFLWSAWTSARHIPLFIIAGLPILSRELSRLLPEGTADFETPHLRRHSIWVPLALALAFLFRAPLNVPNEFPAERFPSAIYARHAQELQASRLLSTDAWGDWLIYTAAPRQRVFLDGLQDFFGPELGFDYLTMLEAGPRTPALLREWNFDAVLVPVETPLAAWLSRQSGWSEIDRAGPAVYFRRNP